jgi:hypothetical protein
VPATNGNTRRRRSRRSPRSISRRASSPTTRKKNVIRPLFTQVRRSRVTLWSPSRIDSGVSQTDWYEPGATLAQISAATMASTSTPALPDSVCRNDRNGATTARRV